MNQGRDRVKILLVALWVTFTVTLAAWWLVFGLRQLERLNQLHVEQADQIQRHYQMLLWEGGILIAALIGGGLALFYYTRREQKRHAQVEEFFAAFTHDAKTALASLRLQAESLKEDLGAEPNPLLDRLLQDTLRLQLQLENSLFLVNLPTGRLLIEPVQITSLVDALRYHWPSLSIIQKGDGTVLGDARAIESMLTNLVHNAVTHGHASEISISAEPNNKGGLCLRVTDNGSGFPGDFKQLGKLFVRHARGSGSGVGLYISRQLALRMNSTLSFSRADNGGFVAEMVFATASEPALAERRQKLA
ncbi:MAG TPA: HAMP domain-containing sensor histidine kinase [Pyrinomonadaceae bacterium]|nr:HAMP domain-containing sensor histidine kinase [Pyrinomonadaceae bacterium]